MLDLKLGELWRYRDLVMLFTKRSFQVSYKQTILGPMWLFLNPFLTSIVYVVLFGTIAGLSTDGVPMLLFYLTGNAIWNYFNTCVSNNASTFTGNAALFGKVYFPRLVIPVSNVLSSIVRFGIQMILVAAVYIYYAVNGRMTVRLGGLWLVLPMLVVLGMLGCGFGIIISSLTTKYRDLSVLVGFGLQLWMYATPVVYPMSTVTGPIRDIIALNPVTAPVELMRYALLGVGTVSVPGILASSLAAVLVMLLGIMIFNKIERNFMDTV